jgi:hypothetical protein
MFFSHVFLMCFLLYFSPLTGKPAGIMWLLYNSMQIAGCVYIEKKAKLPGKSDGSLVRAPVPDVGLYQA